jgi:hypothetical protein
VSIPQGCSCRSWSCNFPESPQFLSCSQKPGAKSHKTSAKWLGSCWKTKPSDSTPELSSLAPQQSLAEY